LKNPETGEKEEIGTPSGDFLSEMQSMFMILEITGITK
jgi:hypothetical protein